MKKTSDIGPAALKAEADALARMGDADIDLSDMPEAADWTGATRGKFHRPIKQQLTLRLDADIVHWFKSQVRGGGYQTRMNQALRDHVERQMRGPAE